MLAILQKELNTFFTSLIAYVTIGFFLIVMGLWIWVFPQANVLDRGYATLQPFFEISPYLLMFLIPAITMRSLAEESNKGTLEVLLTSPLTTTQIILGKYLANLVIISLTLLLTTTYYFSLYYLSEPKGNIDTPAIITSYIGLLLLAGVLVAIGLFASSLTQRQIIAFLISVLLSFLFYQGFDAWATLQTWKNYSLFIAQLGLSYHYAALQKGVLDSRTVIYLLTITFSMLFLTKWVLHNRK